MLRFDTPTARLRAVAFLEGVSYLVLLCVAMPLKYWASMPIAVRIVGSLHGGLFVWLALCVLSGMRTRARSLRWGARIGVASLVPCGTFFLDRELHADDEAFRRSQRERGDRAAAR